MQGCLYDFVGLSYYSPMATLACPPIDPIDQLFTFLFIWFDHFTIVAYWDIHIFLSWLHKLSMVHICEIESVILVIREQIKLVTRSAEKLVDVSICVLLASTKRILVDFGDLSFNFIVEYYSLSIKLFASCSIVFFNHYAQITVMVNEMRRDIRIYRMQ